MNKPLEATFTISATTPAELAGLLRRIADALDPAGAPPISGDPGISMAPDHGEPGAEASPSARWTTPATLGWWRTMAREYLARLTPEARQALLYVAAHAPRVPVSEVAAHLHVAQGPQLAGTLASIGYASKHFGAPEAPLRRVRANYEIDPDLAQLLRQVAAHEEASTRRWTRPDALVAHDDPADHDASAPSATRPAP